MKSLETICREYLEIPKICSTRDVICFYSVYEYFGKKIYKISDFNINDTFRILYYKKSPFLLCCVFKNKKILIRANLFLKNVIKRLKFFERKIGLNFYESVVFDFKIQNLYFNEYDTLCAYVSICFKEDFNSASQPFEFYKNFCLDLPSYQQAIPMFLLKGKYRIVSFSKTQVRYIMRCINMDTKEFLYVYPTEFFSQILDRQKKHEIFPGTWIPKDILEF